MPASVSRRSVVAMRQSYVLLHERPPHHDHAPLRRGHEAELLVQAPHRLVPLLALGEEPLEAARANRSGYLGALERACDPTSAPVAPRGGEPVEALLAGDVQARVAHNLLAREREEEELGQLGRLVDLLGPPPVQRRDAGATGAVPAGLRGTPLHGPYAAPAPDPPARPDLPRVVPPGELEP